MPRKKQRSRVEFDARRRMKEFYRIDCQHQQRNVKFLCGTVRAISRFLKNLMLLRQFLKNGFFYSLISTEHIRTRKGSV